MQHAPTDTAHQEERKHRIQAHGHSSVTRSIANAIVIKDDGVFLLSEPNGQVPFNDNHGFGLYYHDCRFLNGYEMFVADTELDLLVATATHGFLSIVELTNPDIRMPGDRLIAKEQLGIKWERTIDAQQHALCEVLTFHNYGPELIEFPLSLSFRAEFEPLFAVRGMLRNKRGTLRTPCWQNGQLRFSYQGADNIYRGLTIHFSTLPQSTEHTTAHFHFSLNPQERKQLNIDLCIAESTDQHQALSCERKPNSSHLKRTLQNSSDQSLADTTEVRSDNLVFNSVIDRSLRDLHLLKTSHEGWQFYAAGVPWFVTLFGRDSLIASLQMLGYSPGVAEQTLRVLAHYQGRAIDEWRDEQPGKIMHELRVGELAHLNEVPQTPYYGSVDATPLFLILLAEHATWTGSLKLFRELRTNIERALNWIDQYGDQDRDGYVEYQSSSTNGLANQGWKDSGNAIVNIDGSLAKPPIALVEVQGYVYFAKQLIADLFERADEPDRATSLRREAQTLRERFNHDFWLPHQSYYALALQAERKPVAVVSSNPGQALWTGIIPPERSKQIIGRLMADDMFGGWGVRTLSQQERRYNPIGYHLGTVWPHDNSIIAAGCRKYGNAAAACRIFTGIFEAAIHFTHHRLPEVFAGFDKEEYGIPVHYPVACHPQAWAAGSIPFLIDTCLGLRADGFARRLHVVQPVLPEFLRRVTIRRLFVGGARADLEFTRTGDGKVAVEVLGINGHLTVEVERDGKGHLSM